MQTQVNSTREMKLQTEMEFFRKTIIYNKLWDQYKIRLINHQFFLHRFNENGCTEQWPWKRELKIPLYLKSTYININILWYFKKITLRVHL